MSAYKDKKTKKWNVFFYYRDYTGENRGKTKRGFETKREALEWEREFLQKSAADLEMSFRTFVDVYIEDMKDRIKLNTWLTKQNIINQKILPYFGDKAMNDIKAKDVIKWQNTMIAMVDKNGKKFSPTYLKTMYNQLSAIFNHAVRYYELKSNLARTTGNMGKENTKEMLFWTKEEYLKFADVIMDKPVSYCAFELLFWSGLRTGELLALTKEDFNFLNKTIRINKSYQRIKGQDVITDPKTPKSKRTILMPDFLSEHVSEYINSLYKIKGSDRIFYITKSYLHHEMDRGSKLADVKRIRIHDLRHSHVSLLIEMGFEAVAIETNRNG